MQPKPKPIQMFNHKPLELFHLMTKAIKNTHVKRKAPAAHADAITVLMLIPVLLTSSLRMRKAVTMTTCHLL